MQITLTWLAQVLSDRTVCSVCRANPSATDDLVFAIGSPPPSEPHHLLRTLNGLSGLSLIRGTNAKLLTSRSFCPWRAHGLKRYRNPESNALGAPRRQALGPENPVPDGSSRLTRPILPDARWRSRSQRTRVSGALPTRRSIHRKSSRAAGRTCGSLRIGCPRRHRPRVSASVTTCHRQCRPRVCALDVVSQRALADEQPCSDHRLGYLCITSTSWAP